ncbi:unnamed protein product [Dovyalis caffra]|uniref:Uncharacterized protein n=1 Tax=Dovyalis caffra TaxID=77055 RepID=A0AAV1S8N1_9ROSI|nr:unnamed protein product [Dovyalis caffra]
MADHLDLQIRSYGVYELDEPLVPLPDPKNFNQWSRFLTRDDEINFMNEKVGGVALQDI